VYPLDGTVKAAP